MRQFIFEPVSALFVKPHNGTFTSLSGLEGHTDGSNFNDYWYPSKPITIGLFSITHSNLPTYVTFHGYMYMYIDGGSLPMGCVILIL